MFAEIKVKLALEESETDNWDLAQERVWPKEGEGEGNDEPWITGDLGGEVDSEFQKGILTPVTEKLLGYVPKHRVKRLDEVLDKLEDLTVSVYALKEDLLAEKDELAEIDPESICDECQKPTL